MDPPPVDATLTRVEYALRAGADSAAGDAQLTVDVLKEGWVRVELPAGLLVRAARVNGRSVPIIDTPSPHVLLSKPGRVIIALDIIVPLKTSAGIETLTLPPSRGAVSRVALIVPREGIDVTVSGGVLADRAPNPDAPWVAFGRPGQPLAVAWKRRAEERAAMPLRWRGSVIELVGLGEDASSVSATVNVEVFQGAAASIDVAVPDGVAINQVSGPLVADWDFRAGTLKINFLEPVAAHTSFAVNGEVRLPRDGSIAVPIVRLPAAEREAGGVAVEVLGAGEIGERRPRGLDPADPADLGGPLVGRDAPSMQAFRFRPDPGITSRSLSVDVARYSPQPVLIANIEEARYDALLDEEGKLLVRARYAVRNNQRAFLGVTLPADAVLWSASVGNRPLRPGVADDGSLLLPLEKGRSGEEAPAFVVEMTYVQRGSTWVEKGRTSLTLPKIDLPIARTGVLLHHSPRFHVMPEPGAFRVEDDPGPFTQALLDTPGVSVHPEPHPHAAPESGAADLIAQLRSGFSGGRMATGAMPVELPFPRFGPTVFLAAELTAELQAPSIDLSYKRERRW